MSTNDRAMAAQRLVADRVTDKMLTTPVSDLTDGETMLIRAALAGAYKDEIMARIDRLNEARHA